MSRIPPLASAANMILSFRKAYEAREGPGSNRRHMPSGRLGRSAHKGQRGSGCVGTRELSGEVSSLAGGEARTRGQGERLEEGGHTGLGGAPGSQAPALRTRCFRLSLCLFWAPVSVPFSLSFHPPTPAWSHISVSVLLPFHLTVFVRLFSVSLDWSLPHQFLSVCHFECLSVSASFWHLWSYIPVSVGIFVSACCVFLLASLSPSLCAPVSLCLCLPWMSECLFVHQSQTSGHTPYVLFDVQF